MPLLRLEQISPRDRDRVGGKAVGLARLARAGLPVPRALVVPVRVFQAFLKDNGLWERAIDGDPTLVEDIIRAPLNPRFAGALRTRCAGLGQWLAVRSSGVDEDNENASFAGQYQTFLGVRPGDDLEAALKACWASAYAPQVLAYRDGQPPPPGGMAVVIQTLITARCAGVMFTINPLSGSWREMTVEAAWGLGESVVSGSVIPDYYRVRRPRQAPRPVARILARVRLKLIEEQLRPQTEQLIPAEGGTEHAAVPAARVEAPKLRVSELFRLCRLGLRIEARLGGPQDVEWAQDEAGQLFVLQARPVTASGAVQRAGPAVWTRRFVGERWTVPATPLGWSSMRPILEWFVAYPETSRRYMGGEEPMRLVRFAPYLNVSVFRHLAFKLPGAPPPRFMLEMLPPDEERRWLRRHAQAPDLAVYASIFQTTFKEKRWQRFRWNLFTNWRAWENYRAMLDQRMFGLNRPIASRGQARARAAACAELSREYLKVHLCSLLFANIWYQISEAALIAAEHADLISILLQPPADSMTLQTNRALWELGRGELSEQAFLERFGHRAENSWELFSPRWIERPEQVRMLAQATADGPDPTRRAAARQGEAREAMQKLSLPLRALLRLTRHYLRLREEQRFHFDRLLWAWKRAYLWLEDDLKLQIRFLEQGELEAMFRGSLSIEDAEPLISRRRQAWADEAQRWARGDQPPTFLVGDAVLDAPADGVRIQGLGISAGVVTGPVRVLRSLQEAGALQPGEILVTRATDPGWTPLFATASGLIMELGGMLSHGAVVAREYQLPAVVNIAQATARLRDGQTVTVDGSRGVIWIR
ncbi:MAG: PEP/pyruvate-binding domain-containing protein [Myxococcota bacterium]